MAQFLFSYDDLFTGKVTIRKWQKPYNKPFSMILQKREDEYGCQQDGGRKDIYGGSPDEWAEKPNMLNISGQKLQKGYNGLLGLFSFRL